jgi:hypothetical protein
MSLLLMLTAVVFAQEPQTHPSPTIPGSVLGPQLIVWSQTQKPQPLLQPLPPPSQPEQQPEQQQPDPSTNSKTQQQAAAQMQRANRLHIVSIELIF